MGTVTQESNVKTLIKVASCRLCRHTKTNYDVDDKTIGIMNELHLIPINEVYIRR